MKKFTCKYCERTLTSDYRNGWEPEKPVCVSCMDEVRYLAWEFKQEQKNEKRFERGEIK